MDGSTAFVTLEDPPDTAFVSELQHRRSRAVAGTEGDARLEPIDPPPQVFGRPATPYVQYRSRFRPWRRAK
jgi:hypothetical protein